MPPRHWLCGGGVQRHHAASNLISRCHLLSGRGRHKRVHQVVLVDLALIRAVPNEAQSVTVTIVSVTDDRPSISLTTDDLLIGERRLIGLVLGHNRDCAISLIGDDVGQGLRFHFRAFRSFALQGKTTPLRGGTQAYWRYWA